MGLTPSSGQTSSPGKYLKVAGWLLTADKFFFCEVLWCRKTLGIRSSMVPFVISGSTGLEVSTMLNMTRSA